METSAFCSHQSRFEGQFGAQGHTPDFMTFTQIMQDLWPLIQVDFPSRLETLLRASSRRPYCGADYISKAPLHLEESK